MRAQSADRVESSPSHLRSFPALPVHINADCLYSHRNRPLPACCDPPSRAIYSTSTIPRHAQHLGRSSSLSPDLWTPLPPALQLLRFRPLCSCPPSCVHRRFLSGMLVGQCLHGLREHSVYSRHLRVSCTSQTSCPGISAAAVLAVLPRPPDQHYGHVLRKRSW
ncbi:hypothetical protein BD310DRAFT_382503 [Dichomitus squalens]|uniref:Uncharacterized protein n=1 Tax=Dichomitus squalens TaxID=114155 RepID=A0A4Q9P988_9APHY|nr:hypothetical protein BD310DRAFT_382503 [Dichomitus squalens]